MAAGKTPSKTKAARPATVAAYLASLPPDRRAVMGLTMRAKSSSALRRGRVQQSRRRGA